MINHPEFSQPAVYTTIYPAYTGVELEVVHVDLQQGDLTRAHFLDIEIWVKREPYEIFISLHDKRTEFGFDIIKFPDILSNIYKPQATSTFYTELVRLYRINTHTTYFMTNVMDLTRYCMLRRGYTSKVLLVKFMQFLRHIHNRNHLLPHHTNRNVYTTMGLHFTQLMTEILLHPIH